MKKHFQIKADESLMKLLSSSIYSDKIAAVIRELLTNALDVVENKNKINISITGNDKDGIYFSIKDTGPGLSDENVIALLTTYGNSTKKNSENKNGVFGIGSKAPFAYTDDFYVTSVYQNKKSIFRCFKDESRVPTIEKIDEQDTTEPSGLEYKIKIDFNDLLTFTSNTTFIVAMLDKSYNVEFKIDVSIKKSENIGYINKMIFYYTANNIDPDYDIRIRGTIVPQLEIKYENFISKKTIFDAINKSTLFLEYTNLYGFRDKYEINAEHIKNLTSSFVKHNYPYIALSSSEYAYAKIGYVFYNISELIDNNAIYNFDHKDLTITGSRETVENIEENKIRVKEKFKKIIEEIQSYIKINEKCFYLTFQENLEKIYDILLDVGLLSSNYFHLTSEKLKEYGFSGEFDDLYSTRYYGDANTNKIAQLSCDLRLPYSETKRDLKQLYTYSDGSHSANAISSTIYFNINKVTVFCYFSHQSVDYGSLLSAYLKSDIFFINPKNLKLYFKIKKLAADMRSLGLNIIELDTEDKKKFKKTASQKDQIIDKSILTVYRDGEAVDFKDINWSNKTVLIPFYRSYSDLYLISDIEKKNNKFELKTSQIKATSLKTFSKITKAFKNKDYYVILFNNKTVAKNYLKKFIKQGIDIKSALNVIEQLHTTLVNSDFLTHVIHYMVSEFSVVEYYVKNICLVGFSLNRSEEFLKWYEAKTGLNFQQPFITLSKLLNYYYGIKSTEKIDTRILKEIYKDTRIKRFSEDEIKKSIEFRYMSILVLILRVYNSKYRFPLLTESQTKKIVENIFNLGELYFSEDQETRQLLADANLLETMIFNKGG